MNETIFREWFDGSGDVAIVSRIMGRDRREPLRTVMVYCEGMVDRPFINEVILPRLAAVFRELEDIASLKELLTERIDGDAAESLTPEEAIPLVYSGRLLITFPDVPLVYTVDIANVPQRKPEESSTEVSVKGPRDAFTEDVSVNVSLVRKRLKSPSMQVEKYTIGRRSRTGVSLLYIRDIIDPDVIRTIRERLQSLDIDGVQGIAQLEERLSDSPRALFPLLDYVGRPDLVASSLLSGRFAVIADGMPLALVGPCTMTSLLLSPEDTHMPYYYVSLERSLRLIGLLIAIFLPGFWVAVSTYNMDQIPFPLLATITASRLGLPLSGPMDFFLMLGMFEVFREAGVRLPKAVGQTVAVVGGLIIGDAAIRAGITSPTTLVATAVSTVSAFTLVNQTLVGSVTILRLAVLIVASIFGMFGVIASALALLVYMSMLESFGVPFLSPLSPVKKQDLPQTVLARPWTNRRRRPASLNPGDPTRSGESE